MGGFHEDTVYAISAHVALAAGDAADAKAACESAIAHTVPNRLLYVRGITPMTEALLACGELAAARRWADDSVAVTPGCFQMHAPSRALMLRWLRAKTTRPNRTATPLWRSAVETGSQLRVPEALEVLARVACSEHNHRHAARLFGAAAASRAAMGGVRFPVYSTGYDAAVAATREALGDADFDAAWAEGAAMSTEETIAYAQRGRGERKRPASGWESLTPTEHEAVGLVSEGLSNKDIAERMFISPRTVQTHLTHVYAKLGLDSRIQLVQEAARHV